MQGRGNWLWPRRTLEKKQLCIYTNIHPNKQTNKQTFVLPIRFLRYPETTRFFVFLPCPPGENTNKHKQTNGFEDEIEIARENI